MNIQEYCKQFDLIEFVREFTDSLEPFCLELTGATVCFRDVGIIEFLPAKTSNQYLVLSSGIHGNETAPIEIVNDLVKRLLNEQLKLSVNLLVIIGNPKAMLIQERFQGYNLNRLFNGAWKDYLDNESALYEAKRAQLIEESVERFYLGELEKNTNGSDSHDEYNDQKLGIERYHYDLHTAIKPSLHQKFALYPYLENRKHSERQMKFLLDMGIDTILLYHKPSTTFSYFSSHNFKAHGFTLELGKVKPFGENNRQDFIEAEMTLSNLICGDYNFVNEADLSQANIYRVKKELIKTSEMDELGFDSGSTANFTQFDKDSLLLDAGKNSYLAENDGEAIVFPNNKVPVGQRMGLVIEKISN